MKYIVSILIGLLTIICQAQDADITTIPEVTSKSETFDKTVFGKGIWERVEGVDTIFIYSDHYTYSECDNNKRLLKHFSSFSNSKGEVYGHDYSLNPFFGVYKSFYNNGMIKEKGAFCWFGFKVGVWYYYNETGLATNSVDFDAGYKFGYADLFNFCAKRNIPLVRNDNSASTKLSKSQTEKVWQIQYNFYMNGTVKYIQLDGETGEILSEFERPFPEE